MLILGFSIIWPEISSISSALPQGSLFIVRMMICSRSSHLFRFTWFFIHSGPLFLPSWDPLLLLKHSLAMFFISSPPPFTMSLLFSPLTLLTFSSTFVVCLSEEERWRGLYGHVLLRGQEYFWFCKSFSISLVWQS